MRLLKLNGSHGLNFTENLSDNHRPPYAILSHTWGPSKSEVSLDDINSGRASEKAAYDKIEFCKRQCQIDGIQHFWIDTCCINQLDLNELTESINSMFRWYRDATKCYVYLPDVSTRKRGLDQEKPQWELQFQNSRWFTRGWTLQELLAPSTVDFFSREGDWLGNRTTLQWMIYKATAIPTAALNGTPIEKFSIEERMSWSAQRNTTKKEDKAYCLLGLFGVYMPLIYGEGDYAFIRLKKIIEDQYGSGPSALKEQILESLDYGHSFTRLNSISENCQGTFDWIFDTKISSYRGSETRLLNWLSRGDGVFWIRGKPGSGKSTLMKFLVGSETHNVKTFNLLGSWAKPSMPLIFSFYFWHSDSLNMQNSYRGFLSHLLHQVLSQFSPELMSTYLAVGILKKKRTPEDWSLRELQSTLKRVSCRVADDAPICFFIDALDECMPKDLDDVVRVIKELSSAHSKIKFCVSSRLEQKIENRLQDIAQQSMDLHDLTYNDIEKYLQTTLDDCWKYANSSVRAKKGRLIGRIARGSEGVFLWAFFVSRKVRDSIEEGDTLSQIEKNLDGMPRDMMDLYETMFQKSDSMTDDRRAEAATYFNLVLMFGDGGSMGYPRGLILAPEYIIPLYEHFHGVSMEAKDPNTLKMLQRRINLLCVGLVTVKRLTVKNYEVGFFHRTARDFFEGLAAKELLESSRLTPSELCCFVAEGICTTAGRNLWGKLSKVIIWVDNETIDDLHKPRYLQHVDECMSQAWGQVGGRGQNWVYEHFISAGQEQYAADYMGLTLAFGQDVLLTQYLEKDKSMSTHYKDYLLFCASGSWQAPPRVEILLQSGADPNATFVAHTYERRKMSPWTNFLIGHRIPPGYRSGRAEAMGLFLDHEARLDDRVVYTVSISSRTDIFGPCTPGNIRSNLQDVQMIIFFEVNTRYIMENLFTSQESEANLQLANFIASPETEHIQPYVRILLLQPGYAKEKAPFVVNETDGHGSSPMQRDPGDFPKTFSRHGRHYRLPPAGELSVDDSKRLLEDLGSDLSSLTGPEKDADLKLDEFDVRWDPRGDDFKDKCRKIWERSPKIEEFVPYLEQKGLFVPKDDPAVLNGPIHMYGPSPL